VRGADSMNPDRRPLVMVIDDDADIRSAIEELLDGEGFATVGATDGQAALNLIADMRDRPALILLDLMMPILDGWTFCKVRQGVSTLMEIPVVAISAGPMEGPREPLRVLGYAINGVSDELALEILAHLVNDMPIALQVVSDRMHASEVVSLARTQGVSVVCFADLPPSPSSKTRYLVKRLHAALPEVRIVVGRWAPPLLADESSQALRDAGASLVTSTLVETRTYLGGLVEIPRLPVPE